MNMTYSTAHQSPCYNVHMLKKCSPEEFEQYADFAYELAMTPEKCGYHVYYDGVKTKRDFLERGRKALSSEHEEALLFLQNDTVSGMIIYFWEPDELYLQTIVFAIDAGTAEALREFVAYLDFHFAGYQIILGFPGENRTANRYLGSHGFTCIENDYNTIGHIQNLQQEPVNPHIIRITGDNFDLFRTLHSQIQGELYWTADRILEHLDTWTILAFCEESAPAGAIYYRRARNTLYEIFGIDFPNGIQNDAVFGLLLQAAVSDIRNQGGEHIFFMCDEPSLAVTTAAGFTTVGQYVCWSRTSPVHRFV